MDYELRELNFDKIPAELKARSQWVLWKHIVRDGEKTKVPFNHRGGMAKANDRSTWGSFVFAFKEFTKGGYAGLGFEFSEDDPYVGIDLDGCRDPISGKIADWAREIIARFKTYTEVSPSGTGVKMWLKGKLEGGQGRKKAIDGAEKLSDKTPAIEVYDRGRYFAVTGWRVQGEHEPKPAQSALDDLIEKHWPTRAPTNDFYSTDQVVDRARKYLQRVPPSISGQGGHNAAFKAACVLALGFGLSESETRMLLGEWNQLCQPPWSDRELDHKVKEAMKQPGDRNYLRNQQPATWNSIRLPDYRMPSAKKKRDEHKNEPVGFTTLDEAGMKYINALSRGEVMLVRTEIDELDSALGGGIAPQEMCVIAGRPSHGKSAVAMQMIHNLTQQGRNGLLISEEMGELTLGKRTIQFASATAEEHWMHDADKVREDLKWYADARAKCYVAESVRTADRCYEAIEKAVNEHKIEFVVVDYAGMIKGEGRTRYDQISDTSTVLKSAAKMFNIVMIVQAQLNREIEKRTVWKPQMSDLRDTGQIEQDSDIIVCVCWPHKLDPKTHPPHEYDFAILKNRNRPINTGMVRVNFNPSRQMFTPERIEDKPGYSKQLADWNEGRISFEELEEPS